MIYNGLSYDHVKKKILMPIPSASSKIFWPCSNFFDCVQYFLNTFKFFWPWPKVIFYLINLHIWAYSNILNAANFVFELADGLGIRCLSQDHLISFQGFLPHGCKMLRQKFHLSADISTNDTTDLRWLVERLAEGWNYCTVI